MQHGPQLCLDAHARARMLHCARENVISENVPIIYLFPFFPMRPFEINVILKLARNENIEVFILKFLHFLYTTFSRYSSHKNISFFFYRLRIVLSVFQLSY